MWGIWACFWWAGRGPPKSIPNLQCCLLCPGAVDHKQDRQKKLFLKLVLVPLSCAVITQKSEREKPPKIRKKSSQEQSSWELFFSSSPTEKTEKIGKIKGTLVRKVPGNLRSQEFVFFFLCGFSAPYKRAQHLDQTRDPK